jgi:glycogen operon protein
MNSPDQSHREIKLQLGEASPLGATWTGAGVNFAVHSSSAIRIDLCLFDATAEREMIRLMLPARTGDTWHGFLQLPFGAPGMVYGFRATGPFEPSRGLRYTPDKLLLDPYARKLAGRFKWNAALFAFSDSASDVNAAIADSAPFNYKAAVLAPEYDWAEDRPPSIPWRDSIIYELHVKGFTQLHPEVPAAMRGTYLALAHPAVTAYLTQLGVTAVQLLPVQAFVPERFLVEKGLANYWGYNSLAWFSPAAEYAISDPQAEFREMVKGLHAAGLEVILDVVFNHTAEGNELGPTLSLKGLDNATYYRLEPDDAARYQNHTGTGNTLAVGHAATRRLIIDCLKYWAEEMHVDGFRFDLAPVLGRDAGWFATDGEFFKAVRAEPALRYVKLIAEPWDIGPDGYQLGRFPSEWSEWNDRYRDDMRSYWRGDAVKRGAFAERFAGSSDLFRHHARRPTASINFVTCHDGFTLHDLVAYNDKHNVDNLEQNRDGHSHNLSWNSGAEGATTDPVVVDLRERRMRNFLATLLLSQGVPMLLAGDEFGRTQSGNNNAYCQDNTLNWIDWDLAKQRAPLIAFVRQLIFIRKQSTGLRRDAFLKGARQPERHHKDVSWWHPDGRELRDGDWQEVDAQGVGVLIGHAFVDMHGHANGHVLFICNGGASAVPFALPQPKGGARWQVVFDTAKWQAVESGRVVADTGVHSLSPHSCALLVDGEVPAAVRRRFAVLAAT